MIFHNRVCEMAHRARVYDSWGGRESKRPKCPAHLHTYPRKAGRVYKSEPRCHLASLLQDSLETKGNKLVMAFYDYSRGGHTSRLKICQKIYTTGFSAQKTYTLKVLKFRLILLKKYSLTLYSWMLTKIAVFISKMLI